MSLEEYLDSGNQLRELTHGNASLLESLGSSLSCNMNDNSSASIARMANLHANLVYGNMGTINSNNAHSGSSSVVTDANSLQAGGGYVQRSGIANTDPSYLNLPNSPLSFSSNHPSPLGIDRSSIAQPFSSRRDLNNQLGYRRLIEHQQGGTASHQLESQSRGVSLPTGGREDYANTLISKRPRLDSSSENILHRQIIPHVFRDQDYHQQLRALVQQYMLRNPQQGLPQFLGVSAQQAQKPQMRRYLEEQELTRHHLQEQANTYSSILNPQESGICSRRLMQYIYHLRHRPNDNRLVYWRKFVDEYYAPGAKEKWCLSLYDSVGEHAKGVFSQEAWHCSLCGSKSGKGFEAVFEILPRLTKIKFESGIMDENLFLDSPHECRFSSGLMMLTYGKAVLNSVYKQFHVIREGKLRIFFNNELKILSWEFCSGRHEEFVPRQLVASQVNQLVQAAERYQTSVKDNGPHGTSAQDLQSNCNMFLAAGQQLTRNLDSLLVNDLGFPKRYVRCLQVADVVNSMKDLMTFSVQNNIGPVESLRRYTGRGATVDKQTKQTLGRERAKASAERPSSSMNDNSCMTKLGHQELRKAASKSRKKAPKRNPNPAAAKSSCSPITAPNLPTALSHQGPEIPDKPMIRKLLQEMVANSRASGINKAEANVKQEILDEYESTIGNGGNANRDYSKTASTSSSSVTHGNIIAHVKTEPVSFEDMKTNLPDAVRDLDYEFFSNSILSDDWKEVDWEA